MTFTSTSEIVETSIVSSASNFINITIKIKSSSIRFYQNSYRIIPLYHQGNHPTGDIGEASIVSLARKIYQYYDNKIG
jgi:hypothetical protein